MLDNYDSTVRALTQFLIANAPVGAEREISRLQATLDAGEVPNYLNLEFRPEQDVHCSLYVSLAKYGGTRIEDEEGNLWYKYELTCEVSWPTWGSSDVVTCQRRLALMTAITRFAAEVQVKFNEPLFHLSQTKAQREEAKARAANVDTTRRVMRMIEVNAKGMRVGQERTIYSGVDGGSHFMPVGQVYVQVLGREYIAHVTGSEAFSFVRTA